MGRNKLVVWNHFLEGQKNGKSFYVCRFCGDKYGAKNATKKFRHLLQCSKCPNDVKISLEIDKCSRKSTSVRSKPPRTAKVQKTIKNPRTTALQEFDVDISMEEEDWSEKLCRAIFATGAPFAMLEHPLWLDIFKCLNPQFQPVNKKLISTTYLDREYKKLSEYSQAALLNSKDLHIQCNGWSKFKSDGEFMLSISGQEQIFMTTLKKENGMSANILAQKIIEIMMEFSPKKFLVLIGDNTPFVQSALNVVKRQHKHLTTISCIVHSVNLLCDDVMCLTSVKTLFAKAIKIATTIMNNKALSVNLSNLMIQLLNSRKLLRVPAKTKWSSYLSCLESLSACKVAIEQLTLNEDLEADLSDIKLWIFDMTFWLQVGQMTSTLNPIILLITKYEDQALEIHHVYDDFVEMEELLKSSILDSFFTAEEQKTILLSIEKKRDEVIDPIHLAACLLNPATLGNNLSPADRLKALEYIDFVSVNMEDIDDATVMEEIVHYREKSVGEWSKPFLWKSVHKISPISWWSTMCGHTQLSKVACRILSSPVSSVMKQQYSSITWNPNKRREKLSPERLCKLNYIAHNWHIYQPQSRFKRADSERSQYVTLNDLQNNPGVSSFRGAENLIKVFKVENTLDLPVEYEYEWLEESEYAEDVLNEQSEDEND